MTLRLPLRRIAEVTLGKMVQPESRDTRDVEAPYLRAAHIQPNGQLIDLPEQQMWFSQTELRWLDLRTGDVVVVEGGAGYGRSAVLRTDLPGWGFQNSIIRVRPRCGMADGRFVDYAIQDGLSSSRIDIEVNTATIPHFTAEKVARFTIPCPDFDQQRAIADFLDRETAQIDDLIAEQQHFITLLRERASRIRDSVAVHVGHGNRLRFLVCEMDVRAGVLADSLPLMSVSIEWGVKPRDETTTNQSASDDLGRYKLCGQCDLVVNRMRAFQGALGVSPEIGIVSPDYAVLKVTETVNALWLSEVMRTSRFVGEIISRLRGIGGIDSGAVRTPRINVADLCEIRLDAPLIETQMAELEHIVEQRSRVDTLIAEAERNIALCRERRAALITEAVTGRLDVSTAGRAA